MGSKLSRSTPRNFHLLVVAFVALSFLACPDPNKHIWFVDGDRFVKDLELRKFRGKAMLVLSSFSTFAGSCERYDLAIVLKMSFDKEVRESLQFKPERLTVLVNDVPMNCPASYSHGRIADTSLAERGDFEVYVQYDLDLASQEGIRTELYSEKALRIEILMDNFLYFDGDRVPMDPVYALEKQPCSY